MTKYYPMAGGRLYTADEVRELKALVENLTAELQEKTAEFERLQAALERLQAALDTAINYYPHLEPLQWERRRHQPMTSKLIAFDLEIAKTLPEGDFDWQAHRPLGISCAAARWKSKNFRVWENLAWFAGDDITQQPGPGPMTQQQCQQIVRDLYRLVEDGGIIVTVNGTGFDFQVLAEESGMWAECADLAYNYHCDLMLMSVCKLGWRTGLDAFAKGAGIQSKLKEVHLKDGRILEGMSGAKAPEMWAAGEYEAVLAYLKQDVVATLETAEKAIENMALIWQSGSGRTREIILPFEPSGYRMPIVAEMLAWPRPDTSWMNNPPDPDEITGWVKGALVNDF